MSSHAMAAAVTQFESEFDFLLAEQVDAEKTDSAVFGLSDKPPTDSRRRRKPRPGRS